MFRIDRTANGSQVNTEGTPPQPPQPSWSQNASLPDATAHPETPAGSRAMTESESLVRNIKEGVLSGFVGHGTVLTGEATFKGMLRVDGHLAGRVSSQEGTLIVSNNGQVDANVEVAVAQVYGNVTGDIIASKRIELGRAARVTGNIQTPALVIEQGAVFEGTCRMLHFKEVTDKDKERKEGTPKQRKEGTPQFNSSSVAANADAVELPLELSSISDVAS